MAKKTVKVKKTMKRPSTAAPHLGGATEELPPTVPPTSGTATTETSGTGSVIVNSVRASTVLSSSESSSLARPASVMGLVVRAATTVELVLQGELGPCPPAMVEVFREVAISFGLLEDGTDTGMNSLRRLQEEVTALADLAQLRLQRPETQEGASRLRRFALLFTDVVDPVIAAADNVMGSAVFTPSAPEADKKAELPARQPSAPPKSSKDVLAGASHGSSYGSGVVLAGAGGEGKEAPMEDGKAQREISRHGSPPARLPKGRSSSRRHQASTRPRSAASSGDSSKSARSVSSGSSSASSEDEPSAESTLRRFERLLIVTEREEQKRNLSEFAQALQGFRNNLRFLLRLKLHEGKASMRWKSVFFDRNVGLPRELGPLRSADSEFRRVVTRLWNREWVEITGTTFGHAVTATIACIVESQGTSPNMDAVLRAKEHVVTRNTEGLQNLAVLKVVSALTPTARHSNHLSSRPRHQDTNVQPAPRRDRRTEGRRQGPGQAWEPPQRKQVQCFKCKLFGHRAVDCKQ